MNDSLQFWANVAQILSLPVSILALILTGVTWIFPTPASMRPFIRRIRPLLSYIAIAAFFLWLGTRVPFSNSPTPSGLQATNTALQATITALQTRAVGDSKTTTAPLPATAVAVGDSETTIAAPRPATAVAIGDNKTTTTAIPSITAVAPSPTSNIGTACQEWNLLNDFRTWPKPENPNPDSCGNLTWHFMSSSNLDRNSSTYHLLPESVLGNTGEIGTVRWKNVDAPYAGIAYDYKKNSQDKSIIVHTDNSKLVIIGWKSPISGKIRIAGNIVDGDPGCGDGINWFIDKDSSELAASTIDNGGGQDITRGFGGSSLSAVDIIQGEFIYFIFHPRGGDNCDTTFVELKISKL